MTWLSGHALSQTLFTSCYILRLFEIELDEDPARSDARDQQGLLPQLVSLLLKPCVLAIAKSCGLILEEMRKGHVYEEEDFMTNSFGVSLYENFPVASLFGMLDQAECWMQSAGSQWIQSQYDDKEATELIQSLLDRIYFSRVSINMSFAPDDPFVFFLSVLFLIPSSPSHATLTPGQLISPPLWLFFKWSPQSANTFTRRSDNWNPHGFIFKG